MNNKNKNEDYLLDKLLACGFYEQMKRELDSLPTKEELDERFPVNLDIRQDLAKRVKRKKPKYMIYLQRVAVIALAVLTAISLYIEHEQNKYIIKGTVDQPDTQIHSGQNETAYAVDFDNVEVGYMPEGFELTDELVSSNTFSLIYSGKNGEQITVNIKNNDTAIDQILADRFVNRKSLYIYGLDGYCSYDIESNSSLVVWGNADYIIYIVGEIDLAQVLEITNNMTYFNKEE